MSIPACNSYVNLTSFVQTSRHLYPVLFIIIVVVVVAAAAATYFNMSLYSAASKGVLPKL
jgi:hypothetical protein